MEGQDDPALGVCSVGLAGLKHGGDLSHPTEEEQQVAPLLRRVALINPLEHPQIRPRVQLLRAGYLLLWRDRLIDHLDKTHEMATITIMIMRISIILLQRYIGRACKMQSQDAKLKGIIQTTSGTKSVTRWIYEIVHTVPVWETACLVPATQVPRESTRKRA